MSPDRAWREVAKQKIQEIQQRKENGEDLR